VADDLPFTTRLLVRRPADPARFSGTVHLEPFHHLNEDTPGWTASWPRITGTGDAWIGVTISAAHESDRRALLGGVPKLQQFHPVRYGDLELATFPDTGPSPYGNGGGGGGFDAEAFERAMRLTNAHGAAVVNQLGRLVKDGSPAGEGPLPGWPVRRVYAAGWSQTGQFWRHYLESGHHERDRMASGAPLFDVYLIAVGPAPDVRPADAILVHLLSETEIVGTLRAPDSTGADSDAPPFRGYEVPGSFHYWQQKPRAGRRDDDTGHLGPHNDRPWNVLVHALYHHVDRWVIDGVPMPRVPRVERDPAAPDGVARDGTGNARGGLRTVWVDAPVAQYLPHCKCSPVIGSMRLLGDAELAARYPGSGDYERACELSIAQMVDRGWLLADDAATVAGSLKPSG
jgi:hypothetical protein